MFSLNFEMLNLMGNDAEFSVGRLSGYLYLAAIIFSKYRINLNGISHLLAPLVIILVIITASSALHLNVISSRIIDISLIQNIICYVLLLVHERNDPGVLEKGLLSFSIGSSVISILYLFGIGVEYSSEHRVSIFGDNENTIGLRMAISIIFLIYIIFMYRGISFRKSGIMIILFPAMLSFMINTGSRVSNVSFIFMFLLLITLYYMTDPLGNLWSVLVMIGLAIFIVMQLFLSNEMLLNRLVKAHDGNLAGRENIWPAFYAAIVESPFIGYGYSGYEEVSTNIFGGVLSPHNVIIEILLYGGGIALIMYIWFILKILFNSFYEYRLRKKYIGLVLMIAYIGAIATSHVLLVKIMWVILAFNSISICHNSSSEIDANT